MKVLFLILNYKTWEDTLRLAKDLVAEGLEEKYVLIVDNASPNGSFDELEKALEGIKNVEIIQSPENGGFAKGNNLGLRYAKRYSPEYVCIINNDIYFSMATINKLCEWYERLPMACFIAPLQMLPTGKPAIFPSLDVPTLKTDLQNYNPFASHQFRYKENTDIAHVQEVGLIPGAFTFVRYSIFESLGFFDEDTFLFCEERFVAYKSKQAGYRNYIILNETYLHEHSKTISSEASQKRQREMIKQGNELYYRKYSKWPKLNIAILRITQVLFRIFFTLFKQFRWLKKYIVK